MSLLNELLSPSRLLTRRPSLPHRTETWLTRSAETQANQQLSPACLLDWTNLALLQDATPAC